MIYCETYLQILYIRFDDKQIFKPERVASLSRNDVF